MKTKSKGIFFNLLSLFLSICLILPVAGCKEQEEDPPPEQLQVQNLEKLCKVWGYVKYTHPVFLLGEKDWDDELLKLIPEVRKCSDTEKVNKLLHDWFVGLGKIDYGTNIRVPIWAWSKDEDKIVQADTAWISDTSYIGEKLSADLLQLTVIPNVNRTKAPVKFTHQINTTLADFSNEKAYADMDYSDTSYRMLGLFRLWNAMEYYFPYLDILDEDWNQQLSRYIPKIMAGSDKKSYQLTIAAIAAKLQDPHVSIEQYETLAGGYSAPIVLREAEGKIVVAVILDDSCPLKPGDIILEIDGRNVEDKIKELKEYISISSDDKLEVKLLPYLIRSTQPTAMFTMLRDGKEEQILVKGQNTYNLYYSNSKVPLSHERLDGNIGLINPGGLKCAEISSIMEEFKDTNGLIIDLRQYPLDRLNGMGYRLLPYFTQKITPFVTSSKASEAVPGTFIKYNDMASLLTYYEKYRDYQYDKKVVVLMDEHSASLSEYTIMCLRTGDNVIVMGEESIGTDGDVTYLPLPGNVSMSFTGLGFYTPEGGQTQRIGLSPDIRVEPTIQGIKDGRDELKEAAIKYLKENK